MLKEFQGNISRLLQFINIIKVDIDPQNRVLVLVVIADTTNTHQIKLCGPSHGHDLFVFKTFSNSDQNNIFAGLLYIPDSPWPPP